MKDYYPGGLRLFCIVLISLLGFQTSTLFAQINFSQSELNLNGFSFDQGTTTLMFGPDGRLYVADYKTGDIIAMTVIQNGSNDYEVSAFETITGVSDIINHDDDGTACSGTPTNCAQRQVTGLTMGGTAANPIIYASSSDIRIGAGTGGGNGDIDLDTNSGVITRLEWNGSAWDVVDLIRGLPRSEENHSTNGLELATIGGTNYLIFTSGGITNAGGPSINFVFTCEYALSGAVLSLDLDMIDTMSIQTDANSRQYIYDLPTLDDPTRANANGITDPDVAGYNGIDINDPFGGNDGLNQAILESGGPLSMFSPGYRNAYDLVVTENGAVYVTDNGANQGWGGFPVNEGIGTATNNYDPAELGDNETNPTADGEYITNSDHLELITNNMQSYSFGTKYGGHPNPTRANPSGAGLYTAPASSGTAGAEWRTLIYDPDGIRGGVTTGYTNDPAIGLPANWDQVVPSANPVEGDQRDPNLANPDGPDDDPVTLWTTNTNGIDEYTASNFSGAMQGDLIAGHSNGLLRRVELMPDGTLDVLTPSFASGLGGNALGITCNSDTDPFPGTIWAGTLGGKIVILEPADAVTCYNPGDPEYDPSADYDSDGYTNADEIDNGTDHCSGASQPDDFDKSAGAPLVSDLNDTDDDADGILDANDPMQLGDPLTSGSDAFNIPIQNGLFNDQQGLGGLFGLGMTGLMNNGDANPNWLNWLDDRGSGPNPDDVLGGAPGLMTSHMTSGTANGGSNDQEKGYQYGVQTSTATGEFTVSGNLINFDSALQLYGNTAAVGGELGLFIGDGTQSNFIKFVINTNGLTALQEISDTPQTAINVPITIPNRPDAVIFYFRVNPTTGLVTLEYSLDGGARQVAGTITAQGSILTAIQQASTDLMVGFIGTSNTPGVELEGTWDFLNVLGETPFVFAQIPDLDRFIGSSDDNIDLDNFFNDDEGVGNLTYSVTGNTDPSVGASVSGNILTVSYPGTAASSTITVRATDSDTNFIEQSFLVTVFDTPVVLFRVNSGGPQVTAIDGGIDWEEDTKANNSQYLAEADTNDTFGYTMTGYTPEVNLATTPTVIFESERPDITPNPPVVTYSFPVASPGNYEVRIYIGNGWPGTAEPEARIFDIEIEGMKYPLMTDLDLSATYGHQTGTVFTHVVPVSDGFIDISMVHGVIENPIINAIEILDASDNDTPIYVGEIDDQLSNAGEPLDGSLGVIAIGGDGNLSYSASGLPPGVTIEPTNGQIGGTIQAGAETGSPYNVAITVDDSDGLTSDAVTINFVWNVVKATSWRINAGGDLVNASDIGTNWKYNALPGAYDGGSYTVNAGQVLASGIPFVTKDPTIPGYVDQATFDDIFAEERYDIPAVPEMEFTLPLENGNYVVNLYIGNNFSGTSQPGQRVFDVEVEGAVVDNDLDLIVEFGHQIAGMRSYSVVLTDGELNIKFNHDVAENPIINAIEIFKVDFSNPTLTLDPITNQNNAINDNINIATNSTGGDPGESFSYYMTGAPEGIGIDVNTGLISGTIGTNAGNGGPAANGDHSVVVTVMKPNSAPSTQAFSWSITDTWNDKAEDLSYTPRHENSFVQAGNKFYLMGGRESAQTIDIYDYTSNTWNSLVDSAPFEFNHFQAAEYEGLIWLIGMLKDNNFPSEAPAEFIWAFDPANEIWIQGPQIPVSRRRGSSGLIMYNDKFYVIAGNTNGHDGGYVPWFDVYDPFAGTWTQLADAPRARDHFAASLIGDKIYIAGGRLSGGGGGTFAPTIPEVDVYDLLTDSWSTLPAGQNIPTPRGGASSVNFNDKLVIIGGEVQNQDVYGVTTTGALKITEEYDPVAMTWNRLADLQHERHGTQAIVSGNGIFTLAGSPNLGGGNQKNMEYYGNDAPVGTPSVISDLDAPAEVQIADDTSETFDIGVINGNVGIMIKSMAISGPDAADFNIISGELTNQLLAANVTHTIGVSLTGVGQNRTATLTITYNDGATVDITLANDNVPPDVTNPGTQFNNEGDSVSLQIDATDASPDLIYSATGLPPNLSIDPDTGLISGVIQDSAGDAFNEENGLVIIETESNPLDPTWTQTTAGGATGIIAGSNHFPGTSAGNGGTMSYEIQINSAGVYRFNWRSFFSGSNPTEENDNWLRFPNSGGVWFFGFKGTPASEAALIANVTGPQNNIVFPVDSGRESAGTIPDGASGNGYLKIFRTAGSSETYKWQAVTSDFDNHDIYVYFENPGTYTMDISERSAGHAIDRIAMYKVDGQQYTDGELTAAPESGRTGGQGAAENSPYTVQVTVQDDVVPPGETTVEFTWVIGTGENLPPVAVASADPTTGNPSLDVSFTGNLSTDDVAIVSYLWDFMDGNTSTEIDPLHTFADPGTYDVTLTVTDGEGLFDTDTVTIIVNAPPVAVPEADVTSGNPPLTVSFTGSNSTDDVGVISYDWDFMDGNTSTEADPTHLFAVAGIYDVTLTVTDDGGLTDTQIITISVNAPPVAVITSDPISGDAPLDVTFTGSGSTDDIGIVSYDWDFGDGNSSTDADPVHTFTGSGDFVVTLTVTDAGGLTDTETVAISVNGGPTAVITADPLTGEAPLTVNFTGSGSTDDTGIVSYAWDFDDGGTSTDTDPSYTFTAVGTYVVSLTVTDDDGLTDTATVTIDVTAENMAPNAIATAAPTSGDAPLTVIFNGESSTDDVAIVSYFWDFDNGSTSAEINPVYTFTADGTYNVTLTVTDGGGLTDMATVTIVVGDAANLPPVAVIAASPESGEAPLEVNFTGDGSTDDFGVVSYAWDFGDGGTSAEANPTYTYADPGVYTVTLVVTDAGGLTGTTTTTITVTVVAGRTGLILLENPTKDGIARIQILNLPNGVIADNFIIHDSVGRSVIMFDAQIVFQDGEYQIDVASLGIGLYYVTVELSDGDILATKMLVQN